MSFIYPEGFYVTTLSADLTASATSISLTAVPSTVTSGYLVLEPSSATKREVAHFTSVGATTVTCTDDTTDGSDATGRGCKGSITQGANTSHDQGVTVVMAAVEQYWARLYTAFTNDHNTDGSHKTLSDSNGNEWLEVGVTASAVNHIKTTNAATGNDPKIEAVGDDTDVNLALGAQGTGGIQFLGDESLLDSNGNELFDFTATASAVNQLSVVNAATGNGPQINSAGGDDNINLEINPKGTGVIKAKTTVELEVFASGTDTATGDAARFFRVPAELNGFNLVAVAAAVYTAGTTNTLDIQIRNKTQTADMLSTKITIDSTETDSSTASAAVIDTNNDDVATGDIIAIDIDAVHTTPAQGLVVALTFAKP